MGNFGLNAPSAYVDGYSKAREVDRETADNYIAQTFVGDQQVVSGAVRTVAQEGKSDLTPWQKDVNERRRIRAAIKKLESQAAEIEDAVVVDLHQALVRAESRESEFAREASLDLSYAANKCCDPDLRERIEEVRRDLNKLVFPQP